jgi:hypothetical protein
MPRSEKLWNLPTRTTQIDCISFCRAEKTFGIATKSSIFCSAARRDFLELRTKALRSEIFWNLVTKSNSKLTAFCSTVQQKFWNCEQALSLSHPRGRLLLWSEY